jgi:hypothetical protein
VLTNWPKQRNNAVSNRSFFPEHTHIPTSRRTPYPFGGELPREYSHTIDPFVAMTMAASATKNLKMQEISLIHSDFVAEAIGKARMLSGLFFEIP